MNMASMNEIGTYHIHHVVTVTWPTSVSCVTSLAFINPLLWPHGMIKCPLNYVHLRILVKIVGHLGTG